jgi:hypothetical protein
MADPIAFRLACDNNCSGTIYDQHANLRRIPCIGLAVQRLQVRHRLGDTRRHTVNERLPADKPTGAGSYPRLLYLNHQLVNLDGVAEIALTTEHVTLAFAFVPVAAPHARIMLSWQEAQPLFSALQQGQAHYPAWVALTDRIVNLDLAVDVSMTSDEVTLVAAHANAWGGPLPRRWSRSDAQPILAYFHHLRLQPAVPADGANRSSWAAIGEHLINLALVTQVRFRENHIQMAFAGIPRFARSFAYGEAAPLLEHLQHLGVLPIEAVRRRPAGGDAQEQGRSKPPARRRRLLR